VEGMQVIRNLVWGKSEEQNAVASGAGIEVVIAGMRAHRDNVDVQEMGCSALGNLAWSNAAIQVRIALLALLLSIFTGFTSIYGVFDTSVYCGAIQTRIVELGGIFTTV
jgi:hypothetical protein